MRKLVLFSVLSLAACGNSTWNPDGPHGFDYLNVPKTDLMHELNLKPTDMYKPLYVPPLDPRQRHTFVERYMRGANLNGSCGCYWRHHDEYGRNGLNREDLEEFYEERGP